MQRLTHYQPLEYLGSSVADKSSTGRRVAIFAGPLDDSPYLNLPQFQRLLAAKSSLLVALLLCGCSTRVEISFTPTAPGDPTESFSTIVAVDLLTKPEQVPRPRSQPPAPSEAKLPEVEVAGVANFAMIVEGDLHLHTHYHIHLDCLPTDERPASKRNQEKSETEARRAEIDPRCERLLREHEQRVEEWKVMMER